MRHNLFVGTRNVIALITCMLVLSGSRCPWDDDEPAPRAPPVPPYTPPTAPPSHDDHATHCLDFAPLGNLYWGDLHAHTSYSLDSYGFSNRNDPKDAYRFARGATLPIASGGGGVPGLTATLDRPLDFLAVTDHSEFFNATGECVLGTSLFYSGPYCTDYRNQGSQAQSNLMYEALALLGLPTQSQIPLCDFSDLAATECRRATATVWERTRQAAEYANRPCVFTSFVAFEWTAATFGANLHRNVIFNGNKVPERPIDYLDYPSALALWRTLDVQCQANAGCDAITIPHNSNLSIGRMWETIDDPDSIAYMERYQRLAEIYQHRGSSECQPDGALSDPACNFAVVTTDGGTPLEQAGATDKMDAIPLTRSIPTAVGTPDPSSPIGGTDPGYVRPGLARGLAYAATHGGRNPLALGIVGSTDTHNGTPGNVTEYNWVGHSGNTDDTPAERLSPAKSAYDPGGITGIWAPENTREALFAALKRRETYGTSGPRIVLRFYHANVLSQREAQGMCNDPFFPKQIVAAGGVPMGGEVHGLQGQPYFFVYAMQDETPLSTIDIVKLSSSALGTTSVAIQRLSLAPEQRNVVCLFWQDKQYDTTQQTLYYARVLEQPTWRWSHYDCLATPHTPGCTPNELDVMIQERAWSSPIFFTP